MITKTLQGAISIDDIGQYTFVLPTLTGTALPNALDNSTLEEVYININIGRTDLYLPPISSFKGAKNVKIYINVNNVQGRIRIFSHTSEFETNTINGTGGFGLTGFGEVAYLHIVSDTNWMLLNAPSLA